LLSILFDSQNHKRYFSQQDVIHTPEPRLVLIKKNLSSHIIKFFSCHNKKEWNARTTNTRSKDTHMDTDKGEWAKCVYVSCILMCTSCCWPYTLVQIAKAMSIHTTKAGPDHRRDLHFNVEIHTCVCICICICSICVDERRIRFHILWKSITIRNCQVQNGQIVKWAAKTNTIWRPAQRGKIDISFFAWLNKSK